MIFIEMFMRVGVIFTLVGRRGSAGWVERFWGRVI